MVIKVANQYLQQNSLAQVGDKQVPVKEDIIWESAILKYLSEDKEFPQSIVKFERLFQTLSYTQSVHIL